MMSENEHFGNINSEGDIPLQGGIAAVPEEVHWVLNVSFIIFLRRVHNPNNTYKNNYILCSRMISLLQFSVVKTYILKCSTT
jgi:hypothetical protein